MIPEIQEQPETDPVSGPGLAEIRHNSSRGAHMSLLCRFRVSIVVFEANTSPDRASSRVRVGFEEQNDLLEKNKKGAMNPRLMRDYTGGGCSVVHTS